MAEKITPQADSSGSQDSILQAVQNKLKSRQENWKGNLTPEQIKEIQEYAKNLSKLLEHNAQAKDGDDHIDTLHKFLKAAIKEVEAEKEISETEIIKFLKGEIQGKLGDFPKKSGIPSKPSSNKPAVGAEQDTKKVGEKEEGEKMSDGRAMEKIKSPFNSFFSETKEPLRSQFFNQLKKLVGAKSGSDGNKELIKAFDGVSTSQIQTYVKRFEQLREKKIKQSTAEKRENTAENKTDKAENKTDKAENRTNKASNGISTEKSKKVEIKDAKATKLEESQDKRKTEDVEIQDKQHKENDKQNKEKDKQDKKEKYKGKSAEQIKIIEDLISLANKDQLPFSKIQKFVSEAGKYSEFPEINKALPKFKGIANKLNSVLGSGRKSSPIQAVKQAASQGQEKNQSRQNTPLKNDISLGGTPPENESIPAGESVALNRAVTGASINMKATTPSQMYSVVISNLDREYKGGNLSAGTYQSALGKLGISKIITTKNKPHSSLSRADEVSDVVQGGRTRTTTQMVEKEVWENGKMVKKMVPETSTERVPYTKEDPLILENGTKAYQNKKGGMTVLIPGSKGFNINVPYNLHPNEMQKRVNYAYVFGVAASMGLSRTLFPQEGRGKAAGGNLDQAERYGGNASRLISSLLSKNIADVNILSRSDLENMKQKLSFFTKPLNQVATSGRGTEDYKSAQKGFKGLGLMDSSGMSLDWAKFNEISNRLKDNTGILSGSGGNKYELLKKEIQKDHPEWFKSNKK